MTSEDFSEPQSYFILYCFEIAAQSLTSNKTISAEAKRTFLLGALNLVGMATTRVQGIQGDVVGRRMPNASDVDVSYGDSPTEQG